KSDWCCIILQQQPNRPPGRIRNCERWLRTDFNFAQPWIESRELGLDLYGLTGGIFDGIRGDRIARGQGDPAAPLRNRKENRSVAANVQCTVSRRARIVVELNRQQGDSHGALAP